MAAYVQDNYTWTTVAGNKNVTITPSVNGLLVVVFGASGTTSVGTITDDQSGGTYTTISSAVFNTNVSYGAVAVRDALVSSAVLHTLTLTQTGDSGGGLAVSEWSGMTRVGSQAVLQSGKQENQPSAGTPTITFGAAVQTGNPTLGMVRNNSNTAGMAPDTGWTERRDVGYNSPASGLEYITRDSGFTGSSFVWGVTSPSVFAAIGIELDTSSPPAIDPVLYAISMRTMLGVGR
jgi:hypothetical protein